MLLNCQCSKITLNFKHYVRTRFHENSYAIIIYKAYISTLNINLTIKIKESK